MVGKALAKFATKYIDNLDISKFGATLQKAQFDVYKWDGLKEPAGTKVDTIKFFLNPESIKVVKEVTLKEEERTHATQILKYSHTNPVSLEIGELWFDTYDERKSVRKEYIDKLESLLSYHPETHVPNCVVFTWGEFSMQSKHSELYVFAVSKLDVTYSMFLPTGLPCRAKVALCLRQLVTETSEESKESPDHARIYTVKRGDTLQSISQFAYDSPAEWRRIALSNNIDDPMGGLRPGQRLMLPPILK